MSTPAAPQAPRRPSARRPNPGGLPVAILRAAPGTAVLVVAVVAIMGFALAAVPLWFDRSAGVALPALLGSVASSQRGLELEQRGLIAAGPGDPLAGVGSEGEAVRAALPPALAGIVGARMDLVDSQEYLALDPPVAITRIALRIQPSAAGGITYTAGRPPTGATSTGDLGDLHEPNGTQIRATSYEAAISTTTADELNLGIGDTLTLVPGQNRFGGARITITGLFLVSDPEDPRWFADQTLDSPVEVRVSAEVTIYHAVALLSPDAYPALAAGGGTVATVALNRYRWRFPVDPAAVGGVDAGRLATDLAALQASYPYPGTATSPGLSTGLPELLDAYALQRRAAETAFLLATIGPLATGAGIIGLVAATLARRQRHAVLLARARGVGRPQLLRAVVLNAAVLVVVPSLAGAAVAAEVVTGGPTSMAATAAILVGLVAGAVIVGVTVPSLQGAAGTRATRRSPGTATTQRRRVAEAFVVVVAVLGAVLLRTRGTASTGSAGLAGGGTGADLAAAAIPVLLALAGGVVVIRLFDALIAGLGRVAAGARGFAAVHALRGLRRGSGGHEAALVILVVAVTAGAFSAVIAATLDGTQRQAAADSVGADFRVEAISRGGFPAGLDLAALARIGPEATVVERVGTLAAQSVAGEPVVMAGIDPAAYRRVVEGTLADQGLAAALARPAAGSGAVGTETNPLALVLGARLASRDGLAPGARVTLTMGGGAVPGVVDAVVGSLPGVPADVGLAVRVDDLRAVSPGVGLPAMVAFVRAPEDAAVAIGAVLAPYAGQLVVTSRGDLVSSLRNAPLAATIRTGFLLALLLAAAFAAVVVVATLAQSLALRARETVILRALGVPAVLAASTVVAAVGLTVVVAIATGLGLGAGVAWLTVPGLGIERLAGTSAPAPAVIEVWSLVLGAAGPAVAGVLAVLVGLVVGARASGGAAHLLADEP